MTLGDDGTVVLSLRTGVGTGAIIMMGVGTVTGNETGILTGNNAGTLTGKETGTLTGADTGTVKTTQGGICWALGKTRPVQLRLSFPGVARLGPIHNSLLAHFCNENPVAVQILDSLTRMSVDVMPLAGPFLAVKDPS